MRRSLAPITTGFCIAIFIYLIVAWIPNLPLASTIAAAGRLSIALQLLTHALLDAATAPNLTLAILVGINAGLVAHYVRQRRSAPSSGIAGGIAGIVASIFGIGCAACGSTLAIALFGAGSGTLVSALPYGGAWLGDLGFAILAVSALYLIYAIRRPLVCEI